ncbi:MAG: glutamate--tRNA ligase [Candidatus Buchananbacteria bacterium]|nr:glutamate--tRNA ligase [Candidatus Buchananbacteria bacterium]
MTKKIITRFAPSPTGFVHVGSLRTALYNYLFTRANKGKFYLRIEDTDQERKVDGAVENLLSTLKIFDLLWDNKKIMVQSERLEMYKQAADQLVKSGHAYYCFCSKERLENLRQIQSKKGLPTMYDGNCANLDQAEIAASLKEKPFVIRFKVPKTGQTEFHDLIRGKISFDNKILDDPIILKSDGFPTYHLASVVDDHEMEISHVIRGEEWLPSTPKHLLLYKAFDWQAPAFAHLPLLLNPDKSKLSKRQGDVAVEDYLKKGYLPEALVNFVLLLGWNPGTDQEIFNLDEMIKHFQLEKVNKSGAVFNTQKLDWLNGYYLRKKSSAEFAKLCQPFFEQAGIKTELKQLEKIVATEQERIKHLDEIVEATKFFFTSEPYDPELLIWKKSTRQQTIANLKTILARLAQIDEKNWNQKNLEEEIMTFLKENDYATGDMLWPMRVALTGRKSSPGNFEVAQALGKTESLKRIDQAIKILA